MDSGCASMTFPKARLAVSACLFLGWLGFLFFLWWNAPTVVLSKPQFLIARAYVVVDLKPGGRGPDENATVVSVLWPEKVRDGLEGQRLRMPELASCTETSGFRGPGLYLLPLTTASNSWIIAPLPRLSYFPREKPTHGSLEAAGIFGLRTAWRLAYDDAEKVKKDWENMGYAHVDLRAEELRIYVWNADAKAQVNELIAAKK